jgi:hypothetical protein
VGVALQLDESLSSLYLVPCLDTNLFHSAAHSQREHSLLLGVQLSTGTGLGGKRAYKGGGDRSYLGRLAGIGPALYEQQAAGQDHGGDDDSSRDNPDHSPAF